MAPSRPVAGMDEGLAGIGQRLVEIRGRESQTAFAARLGIHKNTLGNYERGEREIGAGALLALVRMGWDAHWLLTGEGRPRQASAPSRLGEFERPVYRGRENLDQERLRTAIVLVEQSLDGREIGPEAKASLVQTVYGLIAAAPARSS